MITAIAFASCYIYSPMGTGSVCERSRLLRAFLKEGDARFISKYAMRVHQQTEAASLLGGFFRSTDILIPVPGSTPRPKGGVWVADDLARALVQEGVGLSAWPVLRRTCAVRKSATAALGMRPSVALHYESFFVTPSALKPTSVVLIDDVITTGRTMLAAAVRVRETFPCAQVRAFALVRTMGLISGVPRLLEPCKGEIAWRAGDARRNP